MPYSSQISLTRTLASLCVGGLLLTCASFSASAESPPAIPRINEAAWVPSPTADVIADELRDEMTAALRNDMVAALQPTSAVWKGALDGHLLAREMREEVNDEMKGEMIAGLERAFRGVRNPGEANPVSQSTGPSEISRFALTLPRAPTDIPAP